MASSNTGGPENSRTDRLAGGDNLLPFCDLAGYASFLSWALVVAWSGDVAPAPHADGPAPALSRMLFFGGAAIASYLLFLTGGSLFNAKRKALAERCSFACCLLCSVAFLFELASAATLFAWLAAGVGQAFCFCIWASRLRVLSRNQQKSTVCGAFAIGGFALALWPFMEESAMRVVTAVLPLASFVCLTFARRHCPIPESVKSPIAPPKNPFRRFRRGVASREDRKHVLMKGLHTAMYSLFFGFVTCAGSAEPLRPGGEVAIGVGFVAAALCMTIFLRLDEKKAANTLPSFLLPVTGICMLSIGLLWPKPQSLAFCFLFVALCACYEILNAQTSYAYSDHNPSRCLWELLASKGGSACGLAAGWGLAIAALHVLQADETALTALGFLLVTALATANELLFRQPRLIFREVQPNKGNHLGVLDAGACKPNANLPGKWVTACDELSEQCRLSPRQKEIFLMLAKGRNVQYICNELMLSTPTVKSHIYSIYQKMGIHSHQELIDVIENAVREKG